MIVVDANMKMNEMEMEYVGLRKHFCFTVSGGTYNKTAQCLQMRVCVCACNYSWYVPTTGGDELLLIVPKQFFHHFFCLYRFFFQTKYQLWMGCIILLSAFYFSGLCILNTFWKHVHVWFWPRMEFNSALTLQKYKKKKKKKKKKRKFYKSIKNIIVLWAVYIKSWC